MPYGRPKLSHQVYMGNLVTCYTEFNPYEICVVGLHNGEWQTLWASSQKEVSYPIEANQMKHTQDTK